MSDVDVRWTQRKSSLTYLRLTDQAHNIPWADKTVRKVVWRGTLTGAYHRDRYDWRASQRHRLSHLVANTTEAEETIVLLERESEDGAVEVEAWKEREMIDKWMNVGLVKGVSLVASEIIAAKQLTGDFNAGSAQYREHTLLKSLSTLANATAFGLQCGPGPTDEACRLDGGEQNAECPEYEPSCDEMLSEYQWLDTMSLDETIPYVPEPPVPIPELACLKADLGRGSKGIDTAWTWMGMGGVLVGRSCCLLTA